MFFVYILKSSAHNMYYIGQTIDVAQRLKRHNAGHENFTSKYRPWEVVLTLAKPNRSESMQLEKKLKNLNRRKLEAFIKKYA